MTERIQYDEFSYFHENAEEYGIPFVPPTVRREFVEVGPRRKLSALVWGAGDPQLVFIHGGAQNAHTWDTVALAINVPLIAIDLPGHGHSDGAGDRSEGPLSLMGNAHDVEVVIRKLATNAKAVIGMSLGGLTSIALTKVAPDLVRRLVLIDITPGVTGSKSRAISDFINGPRTFQSFDEILARTIEHNPTRTVNSLRRGILHNAIQTEDGSWIWRYRRHGANSLGESQGESQGGSHDLNFQQMWEILADVEVPTLLVRGMRPQSVVDNADEDKFLEVVADPTVIRVPGAGHSVQGDTPVELAEMIRDFALNN